MANVDVGAVTDKSHPQVPRIAITSAVLRQMEQMESAPLSTSQEPVADTAEAPIRNIGEELPARVVAAAAAVQQWPQSQHLAPIRLNDATAVGAGPEFPCGFRCSNDPAHHMQLTEYLELLAWIRREISGCQPHQAALDFPVRFRDVSPTGATLMLLVCDFNWLFRHVAGTPAQLDAYVSKSGKRRQWLRPAARRLFQGYFSQSAA